MEHLLQASNTLRKSHGSSSRCRNHATTEVFELLGDSEDSIKERQREFKQQRQKLDVHAYLEDCWAKTGFHTAEADRLDEAMQRRHCDL